MKVTVIGNGAVGLLTAYSLAIAGNEVSLAGRPASTSIKAIAEKGCISLQTIEKNQILAELASGQFFSRAALVKKLNIVPAFQERLDLVEATGKDFFNSKEAQDLVKQITSYPVRAQNSANREGNPITLVQSLDKLPEQDVVISTVKAVNINAELAKRVNSISGNPEILVFANGVVPWVAQALHSDLKDIEPLKNQAKFAEEVGKGRVHSGVLFLGCKTEDSSTVVSTRSLPLTYVMMNIPTENTDPPLENLFKGSSMGARYDGQKMKEQLFFKVGVNFVGVLGMPKAQTIQQTYQCPTQKLKLDACLDELFEVLQKSGLHTAQEKPDFLDRLDKAYQSYFDHTASIVKDLNSKTPTELDFIMGAVIGMGQKLGLKTPALDSAYSEAKQAEQSMLATKSSRSFENLR